MIQVRKPESIYQIDGEISNGTFHGRWHFSFGDYYDPKFRDFGSLRVFNDDTLSPGAVWPLHPHRDNEVVTYVAEGEFRHADEHGKGGVLKKGWVQHTTIGRGMWHSEINNLRDTPMRFIQMWFSPSKHGLPPAVEQKAVERAERTDRLLPLVSNHDRGTLPIVSDARVLSSFLHAGKSERYDLEIGRGLYLYVLEGGPVLVNGARMQALASAMITAEESILIRAERDAELLLVEVKLLQEAAGTTDQETGDIDADDDADAIEETDGRAA
ncbi:MAG TPA: pirin family protein [Nitrospirota bacterium]|nr:pirin family protein [Nitrospirota bacterium]